MKSKKIIRVKDEWMKVCIIHALDVRFFVSYFFLPTQHKTPPEYMQFFFR